MKSLRSMNLREKQRNASSADSHRELTVNKQLDKLMGSSGKTAATSAASVEVPDFLL